MSPTRRGLLCREIWEIYRHGKILKKKQRRSIWISSPAQYRHRPREYNIIRAIGIKMVKITVRSTIGALVLPVIITLLPRFASLPLHWCRRFHCRSRHA
jgi:hypothetical protein